MSHFSVLVFAKPNEIDDMLRPYSENEDVEEYCVGDVSLKEKQDFLAHYNKSNPEESKGKTFTELYEIFGENWNYNKYRKEEGVWKEYSTYNPDSKWDWWDIGGRWFGEIPNNSCKANKIPAELVPFAFVDQDGVWHEKGQMGWWGMTANEKVDELWENEFREALKKYKGYVTLLDCHI